MSGHLSHFPEIQILAYFLCQHQHQLYLLSTFTSIYPKMRQHFSGPFPISQISQKKVLCLSGHQGWYMVTPLFHLGKKNKQANKQKKKLQKWQGKRTRSVLTEDKDKSQKNSQICISSQFSQLIWPPLKTSLQKAV